MKHSVRLVAVNALFHTYIGQCNGNLRRHRSWISWSEAILASPQEMQTKGLWYWVVPKQIRLITTDACVRRTRNKIKSGRKRQGLTFSREILLIQRHPLHILADKGNQNSEGRKRDIVVQARRRPILKELFHNSPRMTSISSNWSSEVPCRQIKWPTCKLIETSILDHCDVWVQDDSHGGVTIIIHLSTLEKSTQLPSTQAHTTFLDVAIQIFSILHRKIPTIHTPTGSAMAFRERFENPCRVYSLVLAWWSLGIKYLDLLHKALHPPHSASSMIRTQQWPSTPIPLLRPSS